MLVNIQVNMQVHLFKVFTKEEYYGLQSVNNKYKFEFSSEHDGGIPSEWTGRIVSLVLNEDNGAMHKILWDKIETDRAKDYAIHLKQLEQLLQILNSMNIKYDNNNNNNSMNTKYEECIKFCVTQLKEIEQLLLNCDDNNNHNPVHVMLNKFISGYKYPSVAHSWLFKADIKELLQCYFVFVKAFANIKCSK